MTINYKKIIIKITENENISYNNDENIWSFMLTMHGVYVGKVKAWQIEGF